MPLYDACEDRELTRRIVCIKLDGKVIFRASRRSEGEYVKAADTDEGWLDIYETEIKPDGGRRLKMGPWKITQETESLTDGQPAQSKQTRDVIIKRLTGKVEVLFKE